jgi:hypothetical protein
MFIVVFLWESRGVPGLVTVFDSLRWWERDKERRQIWGSGVSKGREESHELLVEIFGRRERDRERQRQRQRDRERKRERQRQRDRDRERQRQRDRETDRVRQRETDRETERQRDRQSQTERDRQRQRETERDRETETDRDRETETQRQNEWNFGCRWKVRHTSIDFLGSNAGWEDEASGAWVDDASQEHLSILRERLLIGSTIWSAGMVSLIENLTAWERDGEME